jgi:hypothetical protein
MWIDGREKGPMPEASPRVLHDFDGKGEGLVVLLHVVYWAVNRWAVKEGL